MSDLDLSKPVRTKAGDKVEIITTEGRGNYPVIGYIADSDVPDCWTKSGLFLFGGSVNYSDLENIPQKRSGWRAGYRGPDGAIYLAVGSTARSIEECKNRIQGGGENMYSPVYIEWEE